jgi:hypothetical protein
MGGSEAMAVIGIGTTSRATVEDVLAIIALTLDKVDIASQKVPPHPNPLPEGRGRRSSSEPFLFAKVGACVLSPPWERIRVRGSYHGQQRSREGEPFRLATLDRAVINSVVEESASTAGIGVIFLTLDELRAAASRCATYSEKSMKQYGIPSVAEAAALAAAGLGAHLFLPRFCGRRTTASVAILP